VEIINSIEAWIKQLVTKFREKYETLDISMQKQINPLENLSAPLQVEVLRVFKDEKNFQLLVFTHDNELEDLHIKIHGPYAITEEITDIEHFMYQDRFNGSISRVLEDAFLNATKVIEKFRATDIPGETSLGQKGTKGFLWIWYGHFQESDENIIINNIFRDKSGEFAEFKAQSKQFMDDIKNSIHSFGVCIYPPIWIGEVPKVLLEDKLKGEGFQLLQNFIKIEFNQLYKGRILIITNDGYIAIGEPKRELALNFFNEILSIILLNNKGVTSVKEFDITETYIHKERKKLIQPGFTRRSVEIYKRRLKPVSRDFKRNRLIFTKEEFSSILSRSEKITQVEKNSLLLRILLDSFTHLRNGEYSQSFILSWTIIEQFIEFQLEKLMTDRKLTQKRKKKLNRQTIDNKLEILNFSNFLTNKDYSEIMDLKKLRNKFMHRLVVIIKEDAKRSFYLSKALIQNLLGST